MPLQRRTLSPCRYYYIVHHSSGVFFTRRRPTFHLQILTNCRCIGLDNETQARGRPFEDGNGELVRQKVSASGDGVDSYVGPPAGFSAGGVFCSEGRLQRSTYGHPSGLPRIRCKQLEVKFLAAADARWDSIYIFDARRPSGRGKKSLPSRVGGTGAVASVNVFSMCL